MNALPGIIETIESKGHMSIVGIRVGQELIQAILLETANSVSYLKPGGPIKLLFKETEVILAAKKIKEISIQNQLECQLIDVESGTLLSKLKLSFENQTIHAVVPTKSLQSIGLEKGKKIMALVKTNEIMLSE